MTSYSEMREAAKEFVRGHTGGGVLILSTERAAGDEIAQEICGDVLVGIDRYGFREFVRKVARPELRRAGMVAVRRVVREAIAARVAHAAELSYLGEVSRFPGFPRALTDTLEQVRLNRRAVSGDLALLLAGYEAELRKRRFADHATQIAVASTAVREGRSQFRGMAVVLLDVAVRTLAERELLDAVMAGAAAVLELKLERVADEITDLRVEDGSVEIFSTSGEALECVEIARRIVQSGVSFDEVGILLRSPERYQPLVLEGLRRAGVPAYCTRGTARPDASGRAFLALLACAEEGLSASRFAEYLSLGQMPEDEEWVSPMGWERLLVDAAVIGGKDRWERRLAGLRAEWVAKYGEAEDEEDRDRARWRVAQVDALERFALPVIGRLAELPLKGTWGEWIEVLSALAETTLRAPERVVELLAELEPMAEIGPVGIGEVVLVLGPRLNALREAERDSRYGRVWVGGIEEARGMSFRRVFVPGVNEGLFPRPPSEDPLVPGEVRGDEHELLRVAAACASERFSISFSRLDLLTGRERVPSFFAFEVWRAAGGREMDVREFEARARVATKTRIGWPAPEDPGEAIDDAEFDLATLAARAPGSGLYLKKLPGRAVESLRARWVRWHKGWKAADGLYVEEIGSELMKRYGLRERTWTPSMLEQYARCPYRFVLRGMHGLREAERPGAIQRLDAATRGLIFHDVQKELLEPLAARQAAARGKLSGSPPGVLANSGPWGKGRPGGLRNGEVSGEPLAAGQPAVEAHGKLRPSLPRESAGEEGSGEGTDWLERLDEVLGRVADEYEEKLAPAIPQIWRSEVAGIRADLRGWLQQKLLLEPDWSPVACEREFDEVLEGGYRVAGRIDLIERHSSGILRVVDHKTGKPQDPRPEMVGKGEALQPALYGMAAEKALGEEVAMGRLWYATIARNFETVDVGLNDWVRRRAMAVLERIDGAITGGFLPAAPRKDACKGCEYSVVCGPYEEERVAEKSQVELSGLRELRGWR